MLSIHVNHLPSRTRNEVAEILGLVGRCASAQNMALTADSHAQFAQKLRGKTLGRELSGAAK
jgi:hypothetical protein